MSKLDLKNTLKNKKKQKRGENDMSNLKIFTENIEQEALQQVYTLVKQPAFSDCKIRIMPDVHAGVGCVIGFTADLGDKVIPNIVGVDIGCGMRTVELAETEIDLSRLDEVIRTHIPNGKEVHEGRIVRFKRLQELFCYRELKDSKRLERSIGTLGGGNHFIEMDKDSEGHLYLIIHTGSRNLGKQVAEYYQKLAIGLMQGKDEMLAKQDELIRTYKAAGRRKEIQAAVKELYRTFQPNKLGIPKELCYLTGKYREAYLHDMKICQEYAVLNRQTIAGIILDKMGLSKANEFETIHNYIDHDSNIVRKGAISAKKDEMLLIPLNMRDGCILGVGKGNPDWNQSAPHGAGRVMSRRAAKECVDLEEFQESMKGIYTTSVSAATRDEAPMVYKPMEEIMECIKDTVEIMSVLKPIYNFKSSE